MIEKALPYEQSSWRRLLTLLAQDDSPFFDVLILNLIDGSVLPSGA